ncbi:MAG: dephospho-CoA kinase [Clostridiales bacterium]|jgi:dephospho-CoA kinase|nr:dephospho-CoA kinase [Clostridiales bacterium]
MRVIGLTGGIGGGKSTVAAMLAGRGAVIADADKIAREVTAPGGAAYAGVAAAFGQGILLPGGEIDRLGLGEIVFRDVSALKKLEGLTHGHITARILELLRSAKDDPAVSLFVIDAPLLYESGLDAVCAEVWVITAERGVRIERAARRDSTGAERAETIDARQSPETAPRARGAVIINNNGGVGELAEKVMRLLASGTNST